MVKLHSQTARRFQVMIEYITQPLCSKGGCLHLTIALFMTAPHRKWPTPVVKGLANCSAFIKWHLCSHKINRWHLQHDDSQDNFVEWKQIIINSIHVLWECWLCHHDNFCEDQIRKKFLKCKIIINMPVRIHLFWPSVSPGSFVRIHDFSLCSSVLFSSW